MQKIVIILLSTLLLTACSISKQNSSPALKPTIHLTVDKKSNNWQVYGSDKYKFTLKFPRDWEVVVGEQSFSPNAGSINIGPIAARGGHGYDGYFGFYVYDKNKENIDSIISQIGNQFEDRVEERMKYTINGIPTTRVTVSTATNTDWIHKSYVLENDKFIYVLGNGAINNYPELFDQIASTIMLNE